MKKSKVAIQCDPKPFQAPTELVLLHKASTPTPDSKYCTSCYRTLPISYWGVYRSSKDGLSKECKACCTQKHRYPYKDPSKHGFKDPNHHNVIFNVYKSNKRLLMNLLNTSFISTEILAYFPDLKDTRVCKVSFTEGVFKLEVSGSIGFQAEHLPADSFIDGLCHVLDKRRIRLELDESQLMQALDKLYFI